MDFDTTLAAFVSGVQAKLNAHYAARYANLTPPEISIERVVKNVRVVRTETYGHGQSVFCFVRIEDGAILKADGWKRPAKGVRGSIYDESNGVDAVTVYGANYMR